MPRLSVCGTVELKKIRLTVEGPVAASMISSVLNIKAVLKLNASYVWILPLGIMNMLVLPEGNYAINASATMLFQREPISF